MVKCKKLMCKRDRQLRRLEEKAPEHHRDEYLKLCKLRGFVVEKVEETNDLGESKLLAASAEGKLVNLTI